MAHDGAAAGPDGPCAGSSGRLDVPIQAGGPTAVNLLYEHSDISLDVSVGPGLGRMRSMAHVIDDAYVRAELGAPQAVAWMREALTAHANGDLVGPARVLADLAAGNLVFTAGRLRGSFYGYRSYATLPVPMARRDLGADQVVVVHDEANGELVGVAVGAELGPRRTGAIGGVAADVLARRDAASLAIIGSGTQAFTQLWAISSVRPLTDVRVWSPTAGRPEAFASRASTELRVTVRPRSSAREAVDGADMVVLATPSRTPVIEADWLAPGAYVASLGPKAADGAEITPDVAEACAVVATDSPAQWESMSPTVLGTPGAALALGDLVAGTAVGRATAAQRSLFLSVGLAGTEVYLLGRLIGR